MLHMLPTTGGARVVPLWTTGPDGEDKVHLMCGYGHDKQIRRRRIVSALGAAPEGVSGIFLWASYRSRLR